MRSSWVPPELLDPTELERFAARARLEAHSGSMNEDGGRGAFDRSHALVVRGLRALRLAAELHALRKDGESALMPVVWGAWTLTRRVFELGHHRGVDPVLVDAVAACGPRLLEIPGLAERIAGSPKAAVRRALARALPASARAIFHALTRDTDPETRAVAAERLGASADDHAFPASTEGHAEAALARARAVLTASAYETVRHPRRAVAAFARLSDALAVACWERLLSLEELYAEPIDRWVSALVQRRGGPEALARCAARWARRGKPGFVAHAAKRVRRQDAATRARVVEALLAPLTEPIEGDDAFHSVARALSDAVDTIGSSPAHAARLFEAILGCPWQSASSTPFVSDDSFARGGLAKALVKIELPRALRRALVKARREGAPGRWRRVGHPVWRALGPDPLLRRRAWAAIADADASKRSNALSDVFEHRDREKDGTARALAARLFARPALRAALLRQQPSVAPLAARALVRGELELDAVEALLRLNRFSRTSDPMPLEAREATRRLRDEAMADGAGERAATILASASGWVARGLVWEASDLAFARRAVDLALAEGAPALWLEEITAAIVSVTAPESEALLEDLKARASDAQRAVIAATLVWATK